MAFAIWLRGAKPSITKFSKDAYDPARTRSTWATSRRSHSPGPTRSGSQPAQLFVRVGSGALPALLFDRGGSIRRAGDRWPPNSTENSTDLESHFCRVFCRVAVDLGAILGSSWGRLGDPGTTDGHQTRQKTRQTWSHISVEFSVELLSI